MTELIRFEWAVKHLLRNKAYFDILEGFLSELLNTSITIDHLLESEDDQEYPQNKFKRVDLVTRTAEGEIILIEVQYINRWDYFRRVLYSTPEMVCKRLRKGDQHSAMSKIIAVHIVSFDLGVGKDYLYYGSHPLKGVHDQDSLILSPEEQVVYSKWSSTESQTPGKIFPEYYLIKVKAFQGQVKEKFDEWMYFLKHEKIEKTFTARGIQSAMKKLAVFRLSTSQLRSYRYYEESLHDDASLERQLAILRAEGLAQGIAAGLMWLNDVDKVKK